MIGNKLIKIMQETAKPDNGKLTDLLFGEVTSIDPLKIKIDGRFEVDEKFLILGALVKKTIIRIPRRPDDEYKHKHVIPPHYTDVADRHSHTIPSWETELSLPDILLWRGLEVGDRVRLLRINNGQQFFVLEREEGIT